ncbi:MAG: alanine dehydrogenase [Planctomycetes bacterium]|nr:alanine dehydrogenase [Planctomycetota bacterium]
MIIGVPREIHRHEHRVGLNPFAVARLVQQGHRVVLESRAGEAAHFLDRDYQSAGGTIVYGRDEVFGRADLLCCVGPMSKDEVPVLRPGCTILSFHHLAVTPRDLVEQLMQREVTLIGYEVIQDGNGDLPVLYPISVMGGQMAVQIAANRLYCEMGGRGVLMGNVPGVPPPTVLILGAGTVGLHAARTALATGVHVIVLDADLGRLQRVHAQLGPQVVTVMAATERLEQYTAIADVVIGAIQIPGERSPLLITEDMIRAMKPGSVVLDISIDQGGCIETSRPTTLDHPVFVKHDVVHYCVPNMTSNVPRTASRALANAALPYIENIATRSLETALQQDPGLAAGVLLYRGEMVNEKVGRTLGVTTVPWNAFASEEPRS